MNKESLSTSSKEDRQKLTEKIGNTTYTVDLYFNEKAKETMQEKAERMIKNEVKENNF